MLPKATKTQRLSDRTVCSGATEILLATLPRRVHTQPSAVPVVWMQCCTKKWNNDVSSTLGQAGHFRSLSEQPRASTSNSSEG